jgi:hypothetical protein
LLSSPFLHFSGLFETLAFHIDTSAFIAKLELALTSHVITSLTSLDPEFAFWTLLEFCPFGKLKEFLVLLTHSGAYFVLLACHVTMPIDSAVQAVFFLTLLAFKTFRIV